MGEVRLATDEEENRIGALKTDREYEAIMAGLLEERYSVYKWRENMVDHIRQFCNIWGFRGDWGSAFRGKAATAYYIYTLLYGLKTMKSVKAIEGEMRQLINTVGHFFGGPAYRVDLILRTTETSETLVQTQLLLDKLKTLFPDRTIKEVKVDVAVMREPEPNTNLQAANEFRKELGAEANHATKKAIEKAFEASSPNAWPDPWKAHNSIVIDEGGDAYEMISDEETETP